MRSRIWMVCLAVAVLAAGPTIAQLGGVDESEIKGNERIGPPLVNRVMTVNYTDTNVGGPTYNRVVGNCGGISGVGTDVNYHVELFYLEDAAGGTCDINSVQDYDGYVTVYLDPFDPTDALLNCVASNDDGAGGVGTSDINGLPLLGITQYVIVTSAFANGQVGTFTNTITCDVDVALGMAVPALGDMALVVLVLLVLAGGVMFLRSRGRVTGAPA